MITFKKQAVKKVVAEKSLLVMFIVFSGLIIPFGNCQGNNIFANNSNYSLYTNELIVSNLEECQNNIVWLGSIELQCAPLVYSFYKLNDFQPVWTTGNELTSQTVAILDLLRNVEEYGMESTYFDIKALNKLAHKLSTETKLKKSVKTRVSFEFLMTNSIIAFMAHLKNGIEFIDFDFDFYNDTSLNSGLPEYLNKILSSHNIHREIIKLQTKPNYMAAKNSNM